MLFQKVQSQRGHVPRTADDQTFHRRPAVFDGRELRIVAYDVSRTNALILADGLAFFRYTSTSRSTTFSLLENVGSRGGGGTKSASSSKDGLISASVSRWTKRTDLSPSMAWRERRRASNTAPRAGLSAAARRYVQPLRSGPSPLSNHLVRKSMGLTLPHNSSQFGDKLDRGYARQEAVGRGSGRDKARKIP
jgi:hypothetical protein